MKGQNTRRQDSTKLLQQGSRNEYFTAYGNSCSFIKMCVFPFLCCLSFFYLILLFIVNTLARPESGTHWELLLLLSCMKIELSKLCTLSEHPSSLW